PKELGNNSTTTLLNILFLLNNAKLDRYFEEEKEYAPMVPITNYEQVNLVLKTLREKFSIKTIP
ncbi:18189_t:CDS:2, partial [Gigaspora rosea]